MMCDLESSYTDENGMPTDECLKALQNEEVKECFLTICPGMNMIECFLILKSTEGNLKMHTFDYIVRFHLYK